MKKDQINSTNTQFAPIIGPKSKRFIYYLSILMSLLCVLCCLDDHLKNWIEIGSSYQAFFKNH